MIDDPDRCYAAVRSRDPRFDGWFTFGVTTTGIHCRPSCPARTPARANVRFFTTSAAAAAAGFRACKRCHPDAAPGDPAWDQRSDVVARAVRAIADGEVDRVGVTGLAEQLGYSTRHLHRQLVAELGAGPRELARAHRSHTARTLLESSDLPLTEVAFAAGFGSVRQFNDTIRHRFAASPSQLRAAARRRGPAPGQTLRLRLGARAPFDGPSLLRHLAVRAIPGVEEAGPGWHRRSLRLPHGAAVLTLTPTTDAVLVELDLDDPRDLGPAVSRVRRLCDLDADPVAVAEHLGDDPHLGPLVGAAPGLRVPAAPDGAEAVLRAVLGQQVSVAAAAVLAGRVAARAGTPLDRPCGAVTHLLPDAAAMADVPWEGLGVPRSRLATLRRCSVAVASGALDLGPAADRDAARGYASSLAGVGPWTVEVLALRGLHDPDAFPSHDLVVRRSAASIGLPGDSRALDAHARRWRPWRAYAAQHLWAWRGEREVAA